MPGFPGFPANLNWAYIIPILFILILIHELGHFLTARWVGIKVEEFGFGLPPRLFGIVHRGVLYSINLLPIGGFVRMLGEDSASADPAAFTQKRPWQRALVTGAGALMNLVFAMILLTAITMGYGRPTPVGAKINSIAPGSPAEQAGWQTGDLIVSVAGTPVSDLRELTPLLNRYRGQTVEVAIQRGSTTIATTVTPRLNPPPEQGATGVAVSADQVVYQPLPFWEAIPAGIISAFQISGMMLEGLRLMVMSLFNSAINVGPVAGPVGMGQMVGEVVSRSPLPLWVTLANLTALLSLNLFLINLLPLPALDGGRLLFIAIEVLRGRRIHPDREGMVHFVGLVVLLALIMVISVLDVSRLVSGRSLLP